MIQTILLIILSYVLKLFQLKTMALNPCRVTPHTHRLDENKKNSIQLFMHKGIN